MAYKISDDCIMCGACAEVCQMVAGRCDLVERYL